MLASASRTFLEVLIPTAMCGIVEDALRAPQAGLASELYRHAAGTLGQGLLACGLRRHDEAVRRLEISEMYEECDHRRDTVELWL